MLLGVTRVVQNALVFRLLVEELFLVLEGGKLRLDLSVVPKLILRAALNDFQSLHVLVEQLFLILDGGALGVQVGLSGTVVCP